MPRAQQAIVEQKTALQTVISPAHAYPFGELWSINGENTTGVYTHAMSGHHAGYCLGLHRISAPAPANPKSSHFSQIRFRPNF